MSQQLNSQPQFNVPLIVNKVTSKDWYLFWVGLFKGLAPALEAPVIPTGSPFTYSPQVRGFMILTGGTVSLVEFSRDGTTFYNYGTIVGTFPLNAADRIRVTYTVAPTLTFVPT